MYTKKAPSVYIFELCKKVFFTLLIKAKTFTLLHAGWTQERFKVWHFTDANAGRQAPKQQSEPLNEFICKWSYFVIRFASVFLFNNSKFSS
jgi:hypothetical protein